MTYEQIELLVRILAIVIMAIITMVIKPYIDSKVSQEKYEKITKVIESAVLCAEQVFTPEEWKQKKDYVLKYINDYLTRNKFIDFELDEEDINNLIESIVYELKHFWSEK